MRPETKKLIQSKIIHTIDRKGNREKTDHVHVRDIRSILKCETNLLMKAIDTRNKELKNLAVLLKNLEGCSSYQEMQSVLSIYKKNNYIRYANS